jgi:hypothetical protein
MKKNLLPRIATAMTISAFSLAAYAQSGPQTDKTAPPKKTKPAAHKVWTEDDLSTVRTAADRHIDAVDRQRRAADEAQVVLDAAAKKPADGAVKSQKMPPLAQAKSTDDAEAKIAWEQRDIQGQKEYIARLEERLDSATPDERAHLQQLIEQHKQIIVETQKEMQGLEQQKKNFQKKPPASAAATDSTVTSAEARPPSE